MERSEGRKTSMLSMIDFRIRKIIVEVTNIRNNT